MESINLNNYELFLVDYADGLLSPEQCAEVEAFMLTHPRIKEEFELFAEPVEALPDTPFMFKNELKKIPQQKTTVNSRKFVELCIAKAENELPAIELAWFDKMLENDLQMQAEYKLFEKTILKPDLSITFEAKYKLKKFTLLTPKTRTLITYASGAAAVITISLLLTLSNQNETIKMAESVASSAVKTSVTIKESTPAIRNQNAVAVVNSASNQTKSRNTKSASKKANNVTIASAAQEQLAVLSRVEIIEPVNNLRANVVVPSEPYNPIIKHRAVIDIPAQDEQVNEGGSLGKIKEAFVNSEGKVRTSDITWKAATALVDGLNKVLPANRELKKKELGNETLIAYNGPIFAFSTKINHTKN